MHPLNLPAFDAKIRQNDCEHAEIYDRLRRRYVALTPEEWVRQHFTNYLIEHLHYPPGLLANEVSLNVNGAKRRCDSVLYDRNGGRPRLIVEYKAPDVRITQHAFNQISSYNSVLRVDYLIVTNGLEHYILHIDYTQKTAQYLPAVPDFADLA